MKIALLAILLSVSLPVYAEDCVGEGEYQICTDTSTEYNGDTTVSSYDSEGNNYSITSGSREYSDGVSESFSSDSEGNKYSIKSWCDDSGCHSSDSEGNTCTITKDGQMIGC